jgi:hypothetical protein
MIAVILLFGSIIAMVVIAYLADRIIASRRNPPVDWRSGRIHARNKRECDKIADLVSFADKGGIRSEILIDTINYNSDTATVEMTMRRQFFYSSGSWLFPTYKWDDGKRQFTLIIRSVNSCAIDTNTMQEAKYGMSPRQTTLPYVYMSLYHTTRSIEISDDMEHNFHSCLIKIEYDELDVELNPAQDQTNDDAAGGGIQKKDNHETRNQRI